MTAPLGALVLATACALERRGRNRPEAEALAATREAAERADARLVELLRAQLPG
jgi:hypothetical protein